MTDPAPPPTKTPPPQAPQGELSLRTLAMPADTNQNGDIFGGWLLSQMDIAGGMYIGKVAQCRIFAASHEHDGALAQALDRALAEEPPSIVTNV